jgi:hypothetical protein
MAGGLLTNWSGADLVVPENPPVDLAVAPNFERFSGIENSPPLDHPATSTPTDTTGTGAAFGYGWTDPGRYPRPGQIDEPLGQVYTPGALSGVVGVVGGQPLPTSPRITRPAGSYTGVIAPSVQWRLGVGQSTAAGAQQTVALSEITNNPPQPGDLTSIIAGLG